MPRYGAVPSAEPALELGRRALERFEITGERLEQSTEQTRRSVTP